MFDAMFEHRLSDVVQASSNAWHLRIYAAAAPASTKIQDTKESARPGIVARGFRCDTTRPAMLSDGLLYLEGGWMCRDLDGQAQKEQERPSKKYIPQPTLNVSIGTGKGVEDDVQ